MRNQLVEATVTFNLREKPKSELCCLKYNLTQSG